MDDSAIQIIRSHQRQPPVDVFAIASALGLRVSRHFLGEDVAGKIRKYFGGKYEIVINKEDHPRRQRFTVAHEISHFVLHRDLIGDEFVEDAMYRGPLGGAAETQANRLAADILMPHFLIRPLWRDGVRQPEELARRFDVSASAMAIRLEGFKQSRQSVVGL